MLHTLTIDETWINLEHVVKADYHAAQPEGEPFYDEDSNTMRTPASREAWLQLTLTSVHLSTESEGESGNLTAASVSDKVTVRGEHAETAWALLNGAVDRTPAPAGRTYADLARSVGKKK